VSECIVDDSLNCDSCPFRVRDSFRSSVEGAYSLLYEKIREERVDDPFDVQLVPLAESLKIRVISKGPAYKYWLLKPIQVFLSKLLGRHRCFALTRNTDLQFTESHLNDVFRGFSGDYHSLDYEGATDNFNPLISNAICDELSLCMELPPDLSRDFRLALTGHVIDGIPQRWGQLMGSVVSFVVLCIGNAAVVRSAFEQTVHRRVLLSEAPITINGDDGGVRAPTEFLSMWKMLSSMVGLKPSLGKVYSHPNYLNINSTSFWAFSGSLRHVPYVNMGLVYGMKRSSAALLVTDVTSYDDRLPTLGARHHALIESCPPFLVHSVHRLFLQQHASLLSHVCCASLPRYVPEEFGGLGLKPIPLSIWRPSTLDLAIIDHLISHPVPHLRRLPGEAPLMVRSLWTTAQPFFIRGKALSFDLSDRDIGFMDVAVYYLLGFRLSGSNCDPSYQLKRNLRVWKVLRRRFSRDPYLSGTQVSVDDLD
jgi:hypothetical protein